MKREYQIKIITACKKEYKTLLSIGKLWKKCFGTEDDFYPKTTRELVEFFIREKYSFYCLFKNDKLVSSAMVDEFRDKFGITNVCVDEALKGYGSKLLDHIKLFHNSIFLEVWDWKDGLGTLEFYLKNDFQIFEVLDKDRFGSHVTNGVERVVMMLWTNEK